ncbi:WhiB family transcriptional regulator [Georgenia alba]|uniref:Transcriptional regulator WhiB n=1 Tax=Georgenia alba TaxID=2233858 RepID=A0ABW2QF79_9MICO
MDGRAWAGSAACVKKEPEFFFVRGAAQRAAREMCFGCPVRMQCLAEALDSQIEYGVWGGMTERERRAMLRSHPEVRNWDEWLADPENEVELPVRRAPRRAVQALERARAQAS